MRVLNRSMRAAQAILMGAALLAPIPHAAAESVRLMTGPNEFGTGWLFLDHTGCYVATAGHVVAGTNGVVGELLVRDGRGRKWATSPPVVLSSDPDVAVLPVPAANDPSVCGIPGRSRLTVAGVVERARVLNGGTIETSGRGETLRIPVQPFAARADSGRGGIFSVRPINRSDQVAKGWSGSPVTDDAGMIGIVFEAEHGAETAAAVRADVIARLLDASRSAIQRGPQPPLPRATDGGRAPGPDVAPFAVGVLAGETVDPARGPEMIFQRDGRGWVVRPRSGAVHVVLRSPVERTFARVALQLSPDSAKRLIGFEVAVGLAGRIGTSSRQSSIAVAPRRALWSSIAISCSSRAAVSGSTSSGTTR